MKILFDHQIFSSQVHGGVSKYFSELIHCLPQDSWRISAWLSNNEYAHNYDLFKRIPFLPQKDFKGKGRIMAEIGKLYSIYKIKQGDYDVFHQTNFDPYCMRYLGNKPVVTTYHDINFLTEQNYNIRMIKNQKASLMRADRIIAISENTKTDMLKYFNIDENKIQVIHHGISPIPIPPKHSKRIIDSPYILYVGLRHAFKNFQNFIKAFALISKKYPETKVVCTRSPFSEEEKKLFSDLNIAHKCQYIVADELTLQRLYRDAVLFCFPSLYEGFGMPILEAMVNGCPVVLSNASCFPEIASDAALYFNPSDINSIASALEYLLDNETARETFRNKGYERVKSFSWQKCAEAHFKLYKSLL